MCSAVSAVRLTAGHNALRGSGPGQNPAVDHAAARVGCPDRRIDPLCITCCSPSQPSHHAGYPARSRSRRERDWFQGHRHRGARQSEHGDGGKRGLWTSSRQRARLRVLNVAEANLVRPVDRCGPPGKPNSRFHTIVSVGIQTAKCVNCKWQIHNMSTGEPRDRHAPRAPFTR